MRFSGSKCLAIFAAVIAVAGVAVAQAGDPVGIVPAEDDVANANMKRPYSPYAGRGFPTQVYWGDTHVHTDNSLDAKGLGVMLGPEEAFRFARGEEVTTSHGLPFRLSRPLDWLVVADHSDGMGAMKEIIAGNPRLLQDETVRGWHQAFAAGGEPVIAVIAEDGAAEAAAGRLRRELGRLGRAPAPSRLTRTFAGCGAIGITAATW